MAKKRKKAETKINLLKGTAESPTWGDVQDLATRVLEVLGGPKGAAEKLNFSRFYTLCALCALDIEHRADVPILNERRTRLV